MVADDNSFPPAGPQPATLNPLGVKMHCKSVVKVIATVLAISVPLLIVAAWIGYEKISNMFRDRREQKSVERLKLVLNSPKT